MSESSTIEFEEGILIHNECRPKALDWKEDMIAEKMDQTGRDPAVGASDKHGTRFRYVTDLGFGRVRHCKLCLQP